MWLELNTREAPLNDKRFRQAMMFAIDREFIRDKIWFGVITSYSIHYTKLYEEPC